MKVSEIIGFMNPFSDALSTIFVISLISLSVLTLIWLVKSAHAKNWENNWNGGNFDDSSNNLDSQHGSIHELSEAIATKAEKVADIMPSMLLIVGLLGTFLGLGIALNSASEVLASANTASMDSAMTGLMNLMEGLGAKFKTSTWGILCFIVLNVVFNSLGFEEKRLAWVIRKSRSETENKIREQKELEKKRFDLVSEKIEAVRKDSQSQYKGFLNAYIQSSKAQQELMKQINSKQISELVKTRQVICDFKEENIESKKQLIEDMDSQNRSVIYTLTTGFEQNHKYMQKSSQDSLEELKKIAGYNEQTQHAMQEFVDNTVQSMSSIGDSAEQMAKAANAVGSSATELNRVVDKLQDELKSVIDMISHDLGNTITNMGHSFEASMDQMSVSMNIATQGISNAVSNLSDSISQTMQTVESVIGESMDLQKKSANEFTVTSESLNIKIIEMTNLVQQLSKDITSGLQAVSENGRRVLSLTKKFETNTEQVTEIVNCNKQLLDTLSKNGERTISLTKKVENNTEQVTKFVDCNRQLLDTLQDLGQKAGTIDSDLNTLLNTLEKSIKGVLQELQRNTEAVLLEKKSLNPLPISEQEIATPSPTDSENKS